MATEEMPNPIAGARVHVTEGEIAGAVPEVSGTYTETPVFRCA